MLEVLLLLSAPVIGILVGLLPSIGMIAIMTLFYPILNFFDPLFLIIFYAIASNARDFSGSVSALNFGILGEITSLPALKERSILLDAGHQLSALRNTMYGSMLGVIIGIIFLLISLWSMSHFTVFLRTDVLAIFIVFTLLILLTWKNRNLKINLLLLLLGYIVGNIGFNHIDHTEFMTFGNVYLSGGIPSLPFLLGLYAIPKILEVIQINEIKSVIIIKEKLKKFQWRNSLLGSLIGCVCGLIPFIGNTISSNVAHSVKLFLNRKHSVDESLGRLVCAESSNNASQVTVLIPLLALGIALQPSELILLDLIENKGWTISGGVDWKLVVWLIMGILIGCVVTSIICYNFVKPLVFYFSKHIKKITRVFVILILGNILYIGFNMDQAVYYLSVFLVCSIIGIFLQRLKIDCVPLLLSFLLAGNLQESIYRLNLIYMG